MVVFSFTTRSTTGRNVIDVYNGQDVSRSELIGTYHIASRRNVLVEPVSSTSHSMLIHLRDVSRRSWEETRGFILLSSVKGKLKCLKLFSIQDVFCTKIVYAYTVHIVELEMKNLITLCGQGGCCNFGAVLQKDEYSQSLCSFSFQIMLRFPKNKTKSY